MPVKEITAEAILVDLLPTTRKSTAVPPTRVALPATIRLEPLKVRFAVTTGRTVMRTLPVYPLAVNQSPS